MPFDHEKQAFLGLFGKAVKGPEPLVRTAVPEDRWNDHEKYLHERGYSEIYRNGFGDLSMRDTEGKPVFWSHEANAIYPGTEEDHAADAAWDDLGPYKPDAQTLQRLQDPSTWEQDYDLDAAEEASYFQQWDPEAYKQLGEMLGGQFDEAKLRQILNRPEGATEELDLVEGMQELEDLGNIHPRDSLMRAPDEPYWDPDTQTTVNPGLELQKGASDAAMAVDHDFGALSALQRLKTASDAIITPPGSHTGQATEAGIAKIKQRDINASPGGYASLEKLGNIAPSPSAGGVGQAHDALNAFIQRDPVTVHPQSWQGPYAQANDPVHGASNVFGHSLFKSRGLGSMVTGPGTGAWDGGFGRTEKIGGVVADMAGKYQEAIEGWDPTAQSALTGGILGGAGMGTLGALSGGLMGMTSRDKLHQAHGMSLAQQGVRPELIEKMMEGMPLSSGERRELEEMGLDYDQLAPKPGMLRGAAEGGVGGLLAGGTLGAGIGAGASELSRMKPWIELRGKASKTGPLRGVAEGLTDFGWDSLSREQQFDMSDNHPHQAIQQGLDWLRKSGEDLLAGGLADGKPDSKYSDKELKDGTKVELEHVNDKKRSKEIAKDHLEEIPDYYTRLENMEERAEAGMAPVPGPEKKGGFYSHEQNLEKQADIYAHMVNTMGLTPEQRKALLLAANRVAEFRQGVYNDMMKEDPEYQVSAGGSTNIMDDTIENFLEEYPDLQDDVWPGSSFAIQGKRGPRRFFGLWPGKKEPAGEGYALMMAHHPAMPDPPYEEWGVDPHAPITPEGEKLVDDWLAQQEMPEPDFDVVTDFYGDVSPGVHQSFSELTGGRYQAPGMKPAE